MPMKLFERTKQQLREGHVTHEQDIDFSSLVDEYLKELSVISGIPSETLGKLPAPLVNDLGTYSATAIKALEAGHERIYEQSKQKIDEWVHAVYKGIYTEDISKFDYHFGKFNGPIDKPVKIYEPKEFIKAEEMKL